MSRVVRRSPPSVLEGDAVLQDSVTMRKDHLDAAFSITGT